MNAQDQLKNIAFVETRRILSNHVTDMMRAGVPDHVCVAVLGSIVGQLIGMNHPEEKHGEIIDAMKEPMLASAKKARALKDIVMQGYGVRF